MCYAVNRKALCKLLCSSLLSRTPGKDSILRSAQETARLFAMLWLGYADSVIGCFNAKYTYGFWRPVKAISAGGGNLDLAGDPGWLPPGTTPNHPEYPAAHGCVTGAVSSLIAGYFGATRVHIVADSLACSESSQSDLWAGSRSASPR
jgi:hypothetical protein